MTENINVDLSDFFIGSSSYEYTNFATFMSTERTDKNWAKGDYSAQQIKSAIQKGDIRVILHAAVHTDNSEKKKGIYLQIMSAQKPQILKEVMQRSFENGLFLTTDAPASAIAGLKMAYQEYCQQSPKNMHTQKIYKKILELSEQKYGLYCLNEMLFLRTGELLDMQYYDGVSSMPRKREEMYQRNRIISGKSTHSQIPEIIVAYEPQLNAYQSATGKYNLPKRVYSFTNLDQQKQDSLGLGVYLSQLASSYRPSIQDQKRFEDLKKATDHYFDTCNYVLDIMGKPDPLTGQWMDVQEVSKAEWRFEFHLIEQSMSQGIQPSEIKKIQHLETLLKQIKQEEPTLLDEFVQTKKPIVIFNYALHQSGGYVAPYASNYPKHPQGAYIVCDENTTPDRFTDMLHQAINANANNGKEQELPSKAAVRDVNIPSEQHIKDGV